MAGIYVELPLFGEFNLPIFSPQSIVILRFDDVSGRSWHTSLDLHAIDDDPKSMRAAIEAFRDAVYPISCESRVSIETPTGDPISAPLAAESRFPILYVETMKKQDERGNVTVWLGERSALIHTIQLGIHAGQPVTLELKASIWPAAVFCVGNNQARIFPISSLAEAPIRNLYENILACEAEFSPYEEACCFVGPAERAGGPPNWY